VGQCGYLVTLQQSQVSHTCEKVDCQSFLKIGGKLAKRKWRNWRNIRNSRHDDVQLYMGAELEGLECVEVGAGKGVCRG
jgi:hypothetical protein